jgi:5-methylcytosine-specific restriction endonuclease McrA
LDCGKKFKVGNKRGTTAKFCSIDCYHSYRNKTKKLITVHDKKLKRGQRWGLSCTIHYCEQCNKIFKHSAGDKNRFCSPICSQQWTIENSVRAPRNRNRRKSKDTEFSRNRLLVFARDKYRCQYCGRGIKNETSYGEQVVLHADHIVPKSEGGSNELNNLVTACQECNYAKATLKILPSCVPKDEKDSLQLSLLDTVH